MLRLQKYKNWWRDGVIITIQRFRWWPEHLEGMVFFILQIIGNIFGYCQKFVFLQTKKQLWIE